MTSTDRANEIDTLRAALDRSAGWQTIRKATKEGKWKMKTEYFLQYCGYWQGERYKYAGPFASVEAAEGVVKELAVLLDCDFTPPGWGARNIQDDKRYRIVTASEVDLRDFRAFADPDTDTETPLLNIYEIKNQKLRRVLGLSNLGRPIKLENRQPMNISLDQDARDNIAAIQAARPELDSVADVVREALSQYAAALAAKEIEGNKT